jgi:hypothetical protein
MFVKRGGDDGKILSVVKEDDLDENQKLSVKKVSTQPDPSVEEPANKTKKSES